MGQPKAPADPIRVVRLTEPTGVVEVVLDRPAQRNSLTLEVIEALRSVFEGLAADREIKAIVLSARGPVFSAGHDLKQITAHRADPDGGRAFFEQSMQACSRMMQSIMRCPQPVIALVEATATAAGCQLVATCDLAVASEDSHFCTPGVNIGLFCSTPMVALTRNVPPKRAMEMLLLGEMIDAGRAAEWGLVNRVAPRAEARDVALSFARQIAAKSALTVSVGKRAFYDQAHLPVDEAYALAARVMVENLLARDACEGISAFVEKRPPEWKGC